MKIFKFCIIFIFIFISCSRNNDVTPSTDAHFQYSDKIDHIELTSDLASSKSGISYKWTSMCDSIHVMDSFSHSAYFNYPALKDSEKLKIRLTVSNSNSSKSSTEEIPLSKMTLVRLYGLGADLQKEHSNNVNYNWYYDQRNTGDFSLVNCGPTAATMAIKWVYPLFGKTPEDARKTYRPNGGDWYTGDILNYLTKYSVSEYVISVNNINTIQKEIDKGNIVILCLDMYYIRNQKKEKWHADKFYAADTKGWGHFIIIKGYKVVDNETFYQVYDPNSWGARYANDTLKGIDRYYRGEDLFKAVTNWWKYAIVVTKGSAKEAQYGVDINSIEQKWGR